MSNKSDYHTDGAIANVLRGNDELRARCAALADQLEILLDILDTVAAQRAVFDALKTEDVIVIEHARAVLAQHRLD